MIVAPGNGGTPRSARSRPRTSRAGGARSARSRRPDHRRAGSAAGRRPGRRVHRRTGSLAFGPTRAAARLEWSKAWAKDFLATPRHPDRQRRGRRLRSRGARRAIARMGLPVVLKADGLAGGKGVFVCAHLKQTSKRRSSSCSDTAALGDAADQVLVEELLDGPELSVLAFTDGERLAVMPPARDYKRLLDGDRGPEHRRHGRLHAAGLRHAEPARRRSTRRILRPTLAGMRGEGNPYRGVLYAGLMLTPRRTASPGIQLSLRRSRVPADPAAARKQPGRGVPGGGRRAAATRRRSAGRTQPDVRRGAGAPPVTRRAPRVGEPIDGLDDVSAGGARVPRRDPNASADGPAA